jgi:hypothetical protein
VQRAEVVEWPCFPGALGDPRLMLEDAAEQPHEALAVHGVDPVD